MGTAGALACTAPARTHPRARLVAVSDRAFVVTRIVIKVIIHADFRWVLGLLARLKDGVEPGRFGTVVDHHPPTPPWGGTVWAHDGGRCPRLGSTAEGRGAAHRGGRVRGQSDCFAASPRCQKIEMVLLAARWPKICFNLNDANLRRVDHKIQKEKNQSTGRPARPLDSTGVASNS